MGSGIDSRIAKARREKGLTQSRLAQLVGVEPHTVSRWERGQQSPTAHADKLADALGVSLDWLVRGENPAESELKPTGTGGNV